MYKRKRECEMCKYYAMGVEKYNHVDLQWNALNQALHVRTMAEA